MGKYGIFNIPDDINVYDMVNITEDEYDFYKDIEGSIADNWGIGI